MLSGPTAHSYQRKKNMRRIKMLARAYDHNGGSKYTIKHIANCTNLYKVNVDVRKNLYLLYVEESHTVKCEHTKS